MDETPSTRNREIDAAFNRARPWLRRLEEKRALAPEARAEFEASLYLWFHRYARRPSNLDQPSSAMRWDLMRIAYRAARELARAAQVEGDA